MFNPDLLNTTLQVTSLLLNLLWRETNTTKISLSFKGIWTNLLWYVTIITDKWLRCYFYPLPAVHPHSWACWLTWVLYHSDKLHDELTESKPWSCWGDSQLSSLSPVSVAWSSLDVKSPLQYTHTFNISFNRAERLFALFFLSFTYNTSYCTFSFIMMLGSSLTIGRKIRFKSCRKALFAFCTPQVFW